MRGLSWIVVLLVCTVVAVLVPARIWGQQVPGNAPVPTVQPSDQSLPPAATSPVASTTSTTSHSPTTQISLNFKDASIDAVLEHLSEVAGFVVVKDGKLDGRVTVLSKQPVSPEEAVALLNTVLKANGFTAIEMGRILKIVTVDKAKRGSIPVHFGADPSQIEETDQLITQVIPVTTMDATKLKTDLQPLIGTDADLTANGGSNTIIITDTSANIRRVVEIIASMDKRDSTENGIRVRQLKYADATATAKLITDIFKPEQQQQQNNLPPQLQFFRAFRGGGGGGGGPGGFGGGGGGGGAGADDSDKGRTGNVVASADTRTNTIVVTGPTDTLRVIDDVLNQLDSNPSADQTFFIYHVKNGQSSDMQNTLNTLFTGQASTNTTNNSTANRSISSAGNRTSTGFGGGSSSFGGNGGSALGGGSGLGGGGGLGGSGGLGGGGANRNTSTVGGTTGNRGGGGNIAGANGTNGPTSAIADLIGQVLVVADQDTNTLLVATATRYEDRVKAIILDLDRPVPQVLIKVLIAEVTHDNSEDLGLDFSVLNLRASGNGQSLVSNLGNAASNAANGGLAVSVMESNVTATLHALATKGKLDVLSRPYILTSDNQEADILVGQEVPFISDTRTDSLGNLINTIQYQSIGVSLDVTPHINPDGLVIMDVNPIVSSESESTVTLSPGVVSPIFNNRSAQSRVGIKDGETIVIGGLMQDQKNQTVTSVPLLGDIPLIGLLFHHNVVTKTKTELLIFLTPHVAQVPERLKQMSADEMRGLRLTPTAVEPGTFQEQIHGMQLGGATTQPAPPSNPGGLQAPVYSP
jgi:general secretion pathway protein D